jgi:predicted unusual protein kinase regulating ubiquinone biosynthesis (AarF/ABC1/UbiB family)
VVVQKNSRIVFIDFGSCGAYTTRERLNWRQLAYYHDTEDIGRMVQAALAILEPLPPVDIDEFTKRVEMVFWQDLYAFKSRHAQWWERTSARIWVNFLALAREYGIPLNLNTLRMIRSTLLYETIAARLYPKVSNYREHRRYNNNAGRRARKRVRNKLLRWLHRGPSNTEYIQIEQLFDMGNRVIYLAQRWLDAPPFRFSMLVDKAVYGISVLVRGAMSVVFLTLGGGAVVSTYRTITGGHTFGQLDFWATCWELLGWHSYQLAVGLLAFVTIRRIMYRFYEKDIDASTSGLS